MYSIQLFFLKIGRRSLADHAPGVIVLRDEPARPVIAPAVVTTPKDGRLSARARSAATVISWVLLGSGCPRLQAQAPPLLLQQPHLWYPHIWKALLQVPQGFGTNEFPPSYAVNFSVLQNSGCSILLDCFEFHMPADWPRKQGDYSDLLPSSLHRPIPFLCSSRIFPRFSRLLHIFCLESGKESKRLVSKPLITAEPAETCRFRFRAPTSRAAVSSKHDSGKVGFLLSPIPYQAMLAMRPP